MKRVLLIGLAVLAVGACRKVTGVAASETVGADKSYIANWKIALTCKNGDHVYLIDGGKLALWVSMIGEEGDGHWDELVGDDPHVGCPQ